MANCRARNTKEAYRVVMQNLRALRRKNGVTIDELSGYLEQHGIYNNYKTIYGWENGIGTPSFDTILLLCKFYGVTDIYRLAEIDTSDKNALETISRLIPNEEETEILMAYRRKKEYQAAVRRLLLEEE